MNASQPPVEAGLPDVLGTKFSDNEIYDFLGLHVAFSAERRGEEHGWRPARWDVRRLERRRRGSGLRRRGPLRLFSRTRWAILLDVLDMHDPRYDCENIRQE